MKTTNWINISSKYMEEPEKKNIGGTVFKMFKSPHDVPRQVRAGKENREIFLELKYLDHEDVITERFENYLAEIGAKSGRIFKVVILNSEESKSEASASRLQMMCNEFDRALERLRNVYRSGGKRDRSDEVLENAKLIEKIITSDIKRLPLSI